MKKMNLKLKSKPNGKNRAKYLEIIWRKLEGKKFKWSNKMIEFNVQDVVENSMRRQPKNIYNFVLKKQRDDI